MKVYIWSPLISSDVGTTWTVLNTAKCLKIFSKNKFTISLINVAKEWNRFLKFINIYNINLIDLNSKLDFNDLPKDSFIKSRITYLIISLVSLIKLNNLLKKDKPHFILLHLITMTPLILMNLFNYETKFILRISGYPKFNFIRKFIWRLSNKKIHKVFCPTAETKKQLIIEKIFDSEKIYVINEPVIDLSKVRERKKNLNNENYKDYGRYIVSIGRLTKQKNYFFLIKNFKYILKTDQDLKLLICGEGEDKDRLNNLIKELNLEKNVFLMGFKKNIFPVLKDALFFVLTSEWEDPGFVLLEAMFFNKIVLSSDCRNGPIELIENKKNGFLYKKGDQKDFLKTFNEVYNLTINNSDEIKKIKFNAKKKTREFSLYKHYKILKNTLI